MRRNVFCTAENQVWNLSFFYLVSTWVIPLNIFILLRVVAIVLLWLLWWLYMTHSFFAHGRVLEKLPYLWFEVTCMSVCFALSLFKQPHVLTVKFINVWKHCAAGACSTPRFRLVLSIIRVNWKMLLLNLCTYCTWPEQKLWLWAWCWSALQLIALGFL